MKIVRYPVSLLLFLLALGLGSGAGLRAEEKTSTSTASEAPAPATPPAPETPPPAPEKSAPTAEKAASANEASAPSRDEAEMRELGTAGEAKPRADAGETSNEERPAKGGKKSRRHGTVHSAAGERINVLSDSVLGEGERADVVVSIVGSSTSAGEVSDAVVSVLGGSRVTGGSVGDAVVSVAGDTYINGHVRGSVVVVLGDLELGPNAVIDGEVVLVGGEIRKDAAAIMRGEIRHMGIRGLTTWFKECVLKARLLAFDYRVWWAWCIALAFLTFYFLLALVVPAAVDKCADTLEQRPGSSVITAVLVLILTPVAYLLLMFTVALGIGVALIPLFSLGLFVASLFGKVTMLAWLGRRFTKLLGNSPLAHPAIGVLIGGAIMLGLYMIPIVGFVSYKLLGLLGLGVVVYTLILQFQAAKAARPAPVPPVPPVSPIIPPVVPAAVPPVGAGEVPPPPVIPVPLSAAPPVISAATLPRAGFWIRLGASFLDFIMVAIVVEMLSKVLHGWLLPGGSVPFWFTVYCVVMWATKGTTIGGIICGLKVVRLDDRPLDWGVAIVRAIGGYLSLAVAGLGFIWVVFDDERQSWHDKIAGTTIVKVPKGTSLM